MDYLIVKWVHILSATLLVGTGFGTAFYLWMTQRTGNVAATAVVARKVVLADWLFTAPTIILQPLTGLYLAYRAGFPLTSGWLLWTYGLYVLAGICWLPVVWLQLRLRDLAEAAAQAGAPLPELYWRYARRWERLGYPAFAAMLLIYWLMVAKPAL